MTVLKAKCAQRARLRIYAACCWRANGEAKREREKGNALAPFVALRCVSNIVRALVKRTPEAHQTNRCLRMYRCSEQPAYIADAEERQQELAHGGVSSVQQHHQKSLSTIANSRMQKANRVASLLVAS